MYLGMSYFSVHKDDPHISCPSYIAIRLKQQLRRPAINVCHIVTRERQKRRFIAICTCCFIVSSFLSDNLMLAIDHETSILDIINSLVESCWTTLHVRTRVTVTNKSICILMNWRSFVANPPPSCTKQLSLRVRPNN